jgi:putative DNA primase/helicase
MAPIEAFCDLDVPPPLTGAHPSVFSTPSAALASFPLDPEPAEGFRPLVPSAPPAPRLVLDTFTFPAPTIFWPDQDSRLWDLEEDPEAWRDKLKHSPYNNRIQPFQVNVEAILDHHPEYRGALAYDEFSHKIILQRTIPGGGKAGDPFDERHVSAFRTFCEERLDISFRTTLIEDGARGVAIRNSKHMIRDFLNRLVWDGTPRLATFAEVYLGAAPTEYNKAVTHKFMVSAVARAKRPGTKVDTVMVLEGPQGSYKSTFCQVLFMDPRLVNDSPIDLRSKEGQIAILGKWCIELAELDSLGKIEASRIKNFLSLATDHFRGHYERATSDHPRSCVFIGTTNDPTFLQDPTGGRRFWPVKVGRIDIRALIRDREQLWAEAVADFDAGMPWHLTHYEEELAREEQDLRRQEHPMEAPIAAYIHGLENVTTNEVIQGALNIHDFATTGKEAKLVGQILTGVFHWRRCKVERGNTRVNGYVPPAT